eukprot:CAMPEP_0184377944 /NCGR_PEP_ID=MMETSP0007-20130409/2678_1 /TAXON_ID=97485 /ORGANISM="Prymnesium parvum, Strain Texoma1" /LENGTH=120 /DNA_ID=CAMNT_0026722019 /DNA_START=168 /DNA_END=530 /DNA_ORIENTATION=+
MDRSRRLSCVKLRLDLPLHRVDVIDVQPLHRARPARARLHERGRPLVRAALARRAGGRAPLCRVVVRTGGGEELRAAVAERTVHRLVELDAGVLLRRPLPFSEQAVQRDAEHKPGCQDEG